MRIATESVSLCVRLKKLTAFVELESAIDAETPRDLIKRATEVGQYPQRDQIDADQ